MITLYQKTVKDTRTRTLKQRKTGMWLHVADPSDEEIGSIVEEYTLEEGHIKDALDPFEVPRLEIKDGVIYIFTRFPIEIGTLTTTTPLLIAIGDNFVATITRKEIPFLDFFVNKKNISRDIEFSTTQKTKFMLLLLTEINKLYNRALIQIRRQIRVNEVHFDNITNKSVMQLVEIESELNDILTALVPMHSNLETLMSGKIIKLYDYDKDIMEDLFLSNGQLIELCKSKLRTTMNIRDAYSTIMTNNLNRVLRFFAALTIILTIPTIFGSLYGMNVNIPFSNSPLAFPIILILVIVISLIVYIFFVKKKWI